MEQHGVAQHDVEPFQCLRRIERDGRTLRQRVAPATLDHPPLRHDQDLAWQHALDALEDRVAPSRELQLQELVQHLGLDLRLGEARFDQRLRLRREGEAIRRLEIIERLDAERVAGEH